MWGRSLRGHVCWRYVTLGNVPFFLFYGIMFSFFPHPRNKGGPIETEIIIANSFGIFSNLRFNAVSVRHFTTTAPTEASASPSTYPDATTSRGRQTRSARRPARYVGQGYPADQPGFESPPISRRKMGALHGDSPGYGRQRDEDHYPHLARPH